MTQMTNQVETMLAEQQISRELIDKVLEFREKYPVEPSMADRITKPVMPFYGKEILEMAIAGILEGENLLLTGPKATGKNVLAENLAWIFGRPSYNVSFHVQTGSAELIGTDTFRNNQVELRKGTICLCAELAQDEGLSPERRQKALKAIVAESNRLKSLVLNALDFSRLERNRRDFHPEAADLAVLAREAAEPLRERFQAGLELPTGPCPACVDHSAFRQVVVILLDNAAKYAAAGGPVTVETEVGLGRVELRVLDRGPGLSREALRHVFDRFWRGDNATTSETGGSGLGLAIARGLANGMGGTLGVVVRPSGGLVFTLRLPA